MVNRGNPNVPNKFKRKANRNKVQKRNSTAKITKSTRQTNRTDVIHPTSGPAAPLSGKKARKVQKALGHAKRRAIEEQMAMDGEVMMTDAPKQTPKKQVEDKAATEQMEVDGIS